jgi:prophage antirepressor-like protein|nr:MAG TPA: repressor domain protein [Caudoviricetes sp.]
MKSLQTFKNEVFGEIRTIEENGKIMFCGNDVAKSLGYANPYDALSKHCKIEGVAFREALTDGGVQKIKFISEGNLYRLITHSKKKEAEQFELWVFDEVLPTIRQTGKYELDTYKPKATSVGEVANILRIYERRMKEQGLSPEVMANIVKSVSEQFGIMLPDGFVRPNPHPQLTITAVYG